MPGVNNVPTTLIEALTPYFIRRRLHEWIFDHDHTGDDGDGGMLGTGQENDGDVWTADGLGGAAWEAPPAAYSYGDDDTSSATSNAYMTNTNLFVTLTLTATSNVSVMVSGELTSNSGSGRPYMAIFRDAVQVSKTIGNASLGGPWNSVVAHDAAVAAGTYTYMVKIMSNTGYTTTLADSNMVVIVVKA